MVFVCVCVFACQYRPLMLYSFSHKLIIRSRKREEQQFQQIMEASNKNAQEQKDHATKEANRVIESNQAGQEKALGAMMNTTMNVRQKPNNNKTNSLNSDRRSIY